MKKKIQKFCCCILLMISIVCCMLPTSILVSAKSKSYDWKKIDDNLWRRVPKNSCYAQQELHIVENSLFSPHYYTEKYGGKWGEAFITSWKMDESYQTLQIITAKKNKVYVQLLSEAGSSVLYVVNLDTLKKKVVTKKFVLCESIANFFYVSTENVSDTSSVPVYIWKFKGTSLKKGKCLGKYIFQTKAIGKYIYYGKYKDSSQKRVTVYRANLDGSHVKKLFTVKGKGHHCQSIITGISKNQIIVSTSVNGKSLIYTYNIKTKKIKKKTN